ncbi:MAG: hypothetical protein OHK0048_06050 [Rhodoferax sp.]
MSAAAQTRQPSVWTLSVPVAMGCVPLGAVFGFLAVPAPPEVVQAFTALASAGTRQAL